MVILKRMLKAIYERFTSSRKPKLVLVPDNEHAIYMGVLYSVAFIVAMEGRCGKETRHGAGKRSDWFITEVVPNNGKNADRVRSITLVRPKLLFS